MAQFRKSKKVGPFRFTVTKRGLSTSFGGGPLRLSRGADGKVRRTLRVPGVGVYDTKVIGQPPKRRINDDSSSAQLHDASGNAGELPPPGYWNGREWTPSPPPANQRRLTIACGVLAAVLLLVVLANMASCGGDDKPAASTVTKTVTVTAQPTTVTSTVTVPQAAAPAPFFEPPALPAAPPATDYPVSPPARNLPPPPSPNVYYEDCAAARAAGAAPLRRGDPGYSSDLDRDGDGIACESG